MFSIALFTYISARFNQNCMKTLKLTDKEHPIVSFLNAYILVWDEFTNSPAYSEYFGGTLTKMLQSYCLAHNLPMNASADDLLADIKANNITLEDLARPNEGY